MNVGFETSTIRGLLPEPDIKAERVNMTNGTLQMNTGKDLLLKIKLTIERTKMSKKLLIKNLGLSDEWIRFIKMADLLNAANGYGANWKYLRSRCELLLNTCSIREKRKKKVFHQLGRWKTLKTAAVVIGGWLCSNSRRRSYPSTRTLRWRNLWPSNITPFRND